MAKKIEVLELEAGTMEDYIHRLIKTCEQKINDKDNPITPAGFQYYSGARNFLFMLLTGNSNPLANPNPEQIKKYLFTGKKPFKMTIPYPKEKQ